MTRHTTVVRYLDAKARQKQVEFSGWSHREALSTAWKFIRSHARDGSLLCFRCFHREWIQE